MSRKNKWRRCGGLEFRRETQRYDDGTPTGGDVLWVRTPKGSHPSGVGRNVAYVTFRAWGEDRGAELGLGVFHNLNSRRDAVACAKAVRRALFDRRL